jgi:hypothetical protein
MSVYLCGWASVVVLLGIAVILLMIRRVEWD